MKKFISAILSIAMVLSCVSISVHAEVTSTAGYTINADTKIISGVAPLTKVGAFESTFSGATVNVVNVDGSDMDDNAYATENVFVNIGKELYKIDVEYPYDPIKIYGGGYRRDGDILFAKESANFNSTVNGQYLIPNSGFDYAISGYKLGDASGAAPALGSGNKTKITKQTENGQPVYLIENDAPRYAFLRSHYSSTSDTALTNATKGKYSVTTVTFKTDKMGNFSLHHNTAGTVGGTFKADNPAEVFVDTNYVQYLPNAVHFTEDGTVKIGATYTNVGVTAPMRTPAHTTDATWEAGKEYTVTVVQKVNENSTDANVYGVYVDGVKIFPTEKTQSSESTQFAYDAANGAYSMNAKAGNQYHGGISSVVLGTAPKTTGDKITLTLSDVKVYALDNLEDFSVNIDKDLALANATGVKVDNSTAKINVYASETVASLRAKYPDYAFSVYNSDGTQPAASANLETGMSAKIVSNDGLQTKLYGIIATTVVPESNVYTVDTAAKTISNVPLFTTVSAFLENFTNGDVLEVVNIDGSIMADDAYATEYVSLKTPSGEFYKINVEYPYDPINSNLKDNTELFRIKSSKFNSSVDGQAVKDGSGFAYAISAYKLGDEYQSATLPTVSAENETVITKQTENGQPVYVLENNAPRYAFLRSHYSTDADTELTDKTKGKYSVTTVSFKTDKMGNFSLHHNVSGTVNGALKPDSPAEVFVPSSNVQYLPNAIHFTEDGTVKIGGTYTNYTNGKIPAAWRTPAHTTSATWEANKEYTVTVVQKMYDDNYSRNANVYGVYLDGVKIFPLEGTQSSACDQLFYSSTTGRYAMNTSGDKVRYTGGISSIVLGAAPVNGNDIKLTLSDVKVYTLDEASAYKPAKDAQITITSNDGAIVVDNGKAVISAMKAVDVADFTSDAKLKLENGYLKAVSADGLAMKTYKIVQEDIRTQFLNGENGPAITDLAAAGNSICFMADVQDASLLNGVTPMVILAAYDKATSKLLNCVIATGTAFTEEITRYKGVLDISEYNKSNIVLRGFVWDGFTNMNPLTSVSELK